MAEDRLKDAAKEHLENLGCTVWGEFFDIKNEKRLDEAAAFLAKHMRGALKVRQQYEEEEPLPEYKGEDIEVVEYDDGPMLRVRMPA